MQTVLIIAVGGSSTPVVTAINDYQPDFVAFVASQDAGGKGGSARTVIGVGNVADLRNERRCPSCGEVIEPKSGKPSIVAQVGLASDRFEVHTVPPDDLSENYATCRRVMADLRRRFPDARMLVDYTGGTKTMSSALVLAAVERGDCELSLVTGQRSDLIRVTDQTETAMPVDTLGLRADRRMALAEELFDGRAYRSAQATLKEFGRAAALPARLRDTMDVRIQLCGGFDAWDRFDHSLAEQRLRPFAGQLGELWSALLAINGKAKTTGYEPVFDLRHNAERRKERARYDDATARLYRAVELLAQRRLQLEHELDTGDLDLQRLPEPLRAGYEARRERDDGKIKLGLQEAYELLVALDDPLGHVYAGMRKPLANALKHRNGSILAHGSTPIDERGYLDLAGQLETLIEQAGPAIKMGRAPRQFPRLKEILG